MTKGRQTVGPKTKKKPIFKKHVVEPSTGSEIIDALGITKREQKVVKRILDLRLNIKTEIVHAVTDFELERFISCFLDDDRIYDIAQREHIKHDAARRYTVSPMLTPWDVGAWAKFKVRDDKSTLLLHTILNGLCSEDLVPAGTYVVTTGS